MIPNSSPSTRFLVLFASTELGSSLISEERVSRPRDYTENRRKSKKPGKEVRQIPQSVTPQLVR